MPDNTPDRVVLDTVIAGREIRFYLPNEGQELAIARAMGAMHRGGISGMMGVSMVLDVIDALLVDPGDKQFLADCLTEGTIGIGAFAPMLEKIAEGDPTPVKPTSRARASGRR